ncbi:PEP-CTERM sorting domain-containing protein [Limnoglobus roseus]|uniref:PEP-CTERM sorting domain-containing protein n=1 Tax=Limnoglobus roseus TaxID=2598579 RepID=A0A5C1AK48_9BACT|nr:PEP-CTERM sorting domain-containing protein [Limnoglobus roseus]QEL19581.1 hypothetical protein PX52LOC_06657 [Limnoglobus roseus]
MKTAFGLLTITAMITLSLKAQAGPLPAWSYRTPTNSIAGIDGLTGGLSFPNDDYASVVGGAIVPITAVYSWSGAPATDPDRVTDLPYLFGVELRDDLSATTAYLSFEGTLTGSLWRTGTELQNVFSDPFSDTTTLGGRVYSVTLEQFDAPTGYGVANGGRIWARVDIRDADEGRPEGPSNPLENIHVPEPSTLVLIGTTVPMVFTWYRGRREKRISSMTGRR